jgi:hypothetical protein
MVKHGRPDPKVPAHKERDVYPYFRLGNHPGDPTSLPGRISISGNAVPLMIEEGAQRAFSRARDKVYEVFK